MVWWWELVLAVLSLEAMWCSEQQRFWCSVFDCYQNLHCLLVMKRKTHTASFLGAGHVTQDQKNCVTMSPCHASLV